MTANMWVVCEDLQVGDVIYWCNAIDPTRTGGSRWSTVRVVSDPESKYAVSALLRRHRGMWFHVHRHTVNEWGEEIP